MTLETEGSADTKEPEIQEAYEIRPPKSITTEATKVIDNAVAHDVPLIQPRPQEVSHANSVSMKNKVMGILITKSNENRSIWKFT